MRICSPMGTVLTAADRCAAVARQAHDHNDPGKQFTNRQQRREKFRRRQNLVGVKRRIAFLAVAGEVSAVFALTGCAPIMSVTGSRLSLLADGLSYVQTGKTLSDHAMSN